MGAGPRGAGTISVAAVVSNSVSVSSLVDIPVGGEATTENRTKDVGPIVVDLLVPFVKEFERHGLVPTAAYPSVNTGWVQALVLPELTTRART
jgi:hypothetical protein